MRLREIFDTKFRDTKFPAMHDTVNFTPDKIGQKHGYYSQVKSTPNNPHEVYKSTKRSFLYNLPIDQPNETIVDAYYDWVKAIAPYAKSNPYLPRVYVVDDKTDVTGKIKPRYQMEKLVDYHEVPLNVLYALYYKEVYEASRYVIDEIEDNVSPENFDGVITNLWLTIINDVRKNSTNNSKIQQALDIIKDLCDTKEYERDMHMGNFMIRLTSIGPQIVFTDPIMTP